MTDEQTKQAILGFAEFFKGITGNQNLEIPSEIAEKYGIQTQADGEYISKDILRNEIGFLRKYNVKAHETTMNAVLFDDVIVCINELPTVSIPPEHDGCRDCRWQEQTEKDMPCRECKQNYTDMWEKSVAIPNKTGYWKIMYEPKNMVVCSKCGKCAYLYNNRGSAYCPHCGCAMFEHTGIGEQE